MGSLIGAHPTEEEGVVALLGNEWVLTHRDPVVDRRAPREMWRQASLGLGDGHQSNRPRKRRIVAPQLTIDRAVRGHECRYPPAMREQRPCEGVVVDDVDLEVFQRPTRDV